MHVNLLILLKEGNIFEIHSHIFKVHKRKILHACIHEFNFYIKLHAKLKSEHDEPIKLKKKKK